MDFKGLNDFRKKLKNSPQMMAEFKKDPEKFLEDISPIQDKNIFKIVLYMVGAVLFLTLGICLYITVTSSDPGSASVPDYLITICSTALGALVGLLIPNDNN